MLVVVLIWVVALIGVAAGGRRVRRVLARLAGPLVRHLGTRVRSLRREPPAPVGRPIEAIARDAHRLSLLFHYPRPGLSFAQTEGRRRAYDRVLGEACQALDVAHLLHVLAPGPELDRERQRVESLLEWSGLRLDDVA